MTPQEAEHPDQSITTNTPGTPSTDQTGMSALASPTIGKIAFALAAAQGEMESPVKDRTVTVKTKAGYTYEFKYATLDAVNNAVRGPLSRHELAVVQSMGISTKKERIFITTLLHSSGEWVRSVAALMVPELGYQALGSALSYMRRYQLVSLLNISAEEDDDGNAADGNTIQALKSTGATVSQAMRGGETGTFTDSHHVTQADTNTFSLYCPTCNIPMKLLGPGTVKSGPKKGQQRGALWICENGKTCGAPPQDAHGWLVDVLASIDDGTNVTAVLLRRGVSGIDAIAHTDYVSLLKEVTAWEQ